jgi:hypothetical protein
VRGTKRWRLYCARCQHICLAVLVSIAWLHTSAVGQEPCGTGSCPSGTFCSEIMPGQCIPNGRVDCGSQSCEPGDQCVNPMTTEQPRGSGSYGAIAMSPTGRWAIVAKHASEQAARSAALQTCGDSGCDVVMIIPPGMCGSLASPGGVTLVMGTSATAGEAALSVTSNCANQFGTCANLATQCN